MKAMVAVDGPAGRKHAVLTNEHAASSYGWPVLVIDGSAYGPGDLPKGTYLADIHDPEVADWARAAEFEVEDA